MKYEEMGEEFQESKPAGSASASEGDNEDSGSYGPSSDGYYTLRVAGHYLPLRAAPDSRCGDIRGIGFWFEGQGSWCVDADQLRAVLDAHDAALREHP